ncbi:hypothetical protein EDD68_1376 [Melghiribacillus thermohalophilus]|uniref:DUF4129 domain-containing protein n=1 Tax=Melghiribacillus thermohalophilus TaxID=1324956 RepID=A0A4R3ML09_9BACI|nr:DUF4129 domain-containing protein [Melghiribacillus thermohalophilus]TCT15288.1 hypothetical protein EDD68_1376 [Melghiribacillus thermohalophilus]
MLNVNLTISRIYQFIGEGIFLYLFIIPFYLPSEETGPFWSYLTVFTASSLFFLFAEKIRTYMPVMASAIFLGLFLLFILQYPLLLSLATSGFIGWRWVVHMMHGDLENERGLLSLTMTVAVIEYMFTGQSLLILLGTIQFALIIFGYMLKHLTMIYRADPEKELHLSKIPLLLTGVFVVFSVLTYVLFDPVKKGVSILVGFFLMTAGWLAEQLYALLGLDDYQKEPSSSSTDLNIQYEEPGDPVLENPGSIDQGEASWQIIDYLQIAGVILMVMAIIGVFVYFYRKRMSVYMSSPEQSHSVLQRFTPKEGQNRHHQKGLFRNRFRQKPDHPVRKWFYEFEQFTQKHGLGRRLSETIEEWFARIGFSPESVSIYQKVRYGDQTLTEEEIEQFRDNLDSLKRQVLEQKEEE